MRTFLIESYWPSVETDAAAFMACVSRVAAWNGGGSSVQWLGCILVPSDGLTLFLVQAESELDVKALAHVAEMPFDRVIEAITVGRGIASTE